MISCFWIDADSIPKNLRSIIMKAAVRTNTAACFVADRPLQDVVDFIADDTHRIRSEAGTKDRSLKSGLSMVVVETGQDSADNYIVEHADSQSLCITHDIPLAARLLEKGCTVIDDRGKSYSNNTIKTMLSERLVNAELRSWGVYAEQQTSRSTASNKLFADNLDRTISSLS